MCMADFRRYYKCQYHAAINPFCFGALPSLGFPRILAQYKFFFIVFYCIVLQYNTITVQYKFTILPTNRYTRSRSQIRTFSARHEFATECVPYNMPRTTSSTPNEIMQTINTLSYSKRSFLQTYKDKCLIQNCYMYSQ